MATPVVAPTKATRAKITAHPGHDVTTPPAPGSRQLTSVTTHPRAPASRPSTSEGTAIQGLGRRLSVFSPCRLSQQRPALPLVPTREGWERWCRPHAAGDTKS